MTGDYRAHSENLREITNRFETSEKNVQDMEAELAEVNDKLKDIEDQLGGLDNKLSDNSHLTNIKKAISNVKQEIKTMDIRIGVISNTLLQCKLKQRNEKNNADNKEFDAMAEVVDENFA